MSTKRIGFVDGSTRTGLSRSSKSEKPLWQYGWCLIPSDTVFSFFRKPYNDLKRCLRVLFTLQWWPCPSTNLIFAIHLNPATTWLLWHRGRQKDASYYTVSLLIVLCVTVVRMWLHMIILTRFSKDLHQPKTTLTLAGYEILVSFVPCGQVMMAGGQITARAQRRISPTFEPLELPALHAKASQFKSKEYKYGTRLIVAKPW